MDGLDLGIDSRFVVLVAGLAAFLACIAPFGFFVPSQSAAIAGGFAAGSGSVNPFVQASAVTTGAFLGGLVGYGIGCWIGDRSFNGPKMKYRNWMRYGQDLMARRAAAVVLVGRWSAATRSTVPNIAGAARYPLSQFAVWNLVTCAAWGSVTTAAGYLAQEAINGGTSALTVASAAVLLFVCTYVALSYRNWRNSNAPRTTDVSGHEVE